MVTVSRSTSKDLRLITLLHIAEGFEPRVNLKKGIDPISTYIRCAELCAASAAFYGFRLTIVTNKVAVVQKYKDELALEHFDVEGLEFRLKVPPNIPFYSAHFKIELIDLIGQGAFGDVVGLIDSDTVFLGSLDAILGKTNLLQVYDISESIIAEYGVETVRRDLEKVSGTSVKTPIWYGGEYLVGTKDQFSHLSDTVDSCWPKYVENISNLHHVGDEMVVSAALGIAKEAGLCLFDAGVNNGIARWWTARTGFEQKPFVEVSHTTLLHLPSDKDFLSSRSGVKYNREGLLADYRKYARGKLLRRRLFSVTEQLRGRPRRFVGRLC